MTSSVSSEAQKSLNGQTDKVSYRADFQLLKRRKERDYTKTRSK